MEGEVDKDEDVHEEDEKEDDYPAFGGGVDAAGSILLGFDRRIEVLRGCFYQRCILIFLVDISGIRSGSL
jgi:hypothetical protein